jgi:hypothetical protein
MRKKQFDWKFYGQCALLVAFFTFIGWAVYAQAKLDIQTQSWLQDCAVRTHGSLEREADGEDFYTDSKGAPSSSSVRWHYYVRTRSGKRIEYKQPFEEE